MIRPVLLFVLPIALAACTAFPELEPTQNDALDEADYPPLVPVAPILANTPVPLTDQPAEQEVLSDRVSSLRARAEALRRKTVLSADDKQRLEEGL